MKATALASLAWLLSAVQAAKQPNILFILTDDQDLHMNSLDYMPLLQKHVIQEGTLFAKHFCTVAICCPSRVNLWTGRAAHNTNVTDVWPPYGGYPKIVAEGINNAYLPVWLQAAGYNTYYAGKLWNAHSIDNYDAPYAQGFNGSDFLLDPYTYDYLNAHMTRNGAPPQAYAGQYSPDITAAKALGFLHEALQQQQQAERPWFVVHAPVAPHSNFEFVRGGKQASDAPRYAQRHAHLFKDYKIPRTADFNPEIQGGVGWISRLPRLNETVLAYNDEFQRARLRALQAVDESVAQLVQAVSDAGQLDNTYVFYTTDNGYHISQHRLHPGKECGFDTDINIPLAVRGPGVAAGHVSRAITAHTDLAGTVLRLAGVVQREEDSDGLPIPLSLEEEQARRHEHVNVEFWGLGIPEGRYGAYGTEDMNDGEGFKAHAVGNNTYKGLRIVNDEYSLYYAVWCTNEHELYDLMTDPHQVHNLLSSSSSSSSSSASASSDEPTLLGRPLTHLLTRLDALLLVLKSCTGRTCTHPWAALHPPARRAPSRAPSRAPRRDHQVSEADSEADGEEEEEDEEGVTSLQQALHPRHDARYARIPRVSFSRCELGYLRDAEGAFFSPSLLVDPLAAGAGAAGAGAAGAGAAGAGAAGAGASGAGASGGVETEDAFIGPRLAHEYELEQGQRRTQLQLQAQGAPFNFRYGGARGWWT